MNETAYFAHHAILFLWLSTKVQTISHTKQLSGRTSTHTNHQYTRTPYMYHIHSLSLSFSWQASYGGISVSRSLAPITHSPHWGLNFGWLVGADRAFFFFFLFAPPCFLLCFPLWFFHDLPCLVFAREAVVASDSSGGGCGVEEAFFVCVWFFGFLLFLLFMFYLIFLFLRDRRGELTNLVISLNEREA